MTAQQDQFGGVVHPAVFFGTHEDHIPEFGEFFAFQETPLTLLQFRNQFVDHLDVVAVAPAVYQAEGMEVRILNEVFEFVGSVVGIDRDQHPSYFRGSEKISQPVGNIVCEDSDFVSLPDTQVQQRFGQVIDPSVEGGIGKAQVPVWINNEILIRG